MGFLKSVVFLIFSNASADGYRNKRTTMRHLFVFALLLVLCPGLQAQEEASAHGEQLTVGLVLSGGGAKGLAHIGVLEVIDSLGIRIDYIGGTSMGAIVGALYASGYSGKALDSIFRATNFTALIQDELPRDVKTFYEKEQSGKYIISLPFDDFNLRFPSGLSNGQNIYNLIFRLTAHLNDIRDFSNMPIPFFAIGTNIETGEEVMLDHGSLPLAVAASAAIPSLFSPVEIEGELLVDGGVVNNYPIRELQKKEMDIIIGVNVQDSLKGREELNSALEILNQINNFGAIQAMEEKIKLTDVYIRPDISEFTILSFDKGKKIIEQGKIAALEELKKLNAIATRQRNTDHKGIEVPSTDSLFINSIVIKGKHNYPRSYVRGKLKIDPDEKISYQALTYGINNLSATNNFERISYNLVSQEKGYDLILNLEESEQKTNLKLAVHYDELYKSAILLNVTHKSLIFNNDIISFDLILGDNIRYNFDYFIDKGRYWSIGFSSRYDQFKKDVGYDFVQQLVDIGDYDVNRLEINYSDFTNRIFVETFFVKAFRLGLGLEHKYVKAKTETILVETPNNPQVGLPFTILEETNLYSALGYLELDTYNKKYFPTEGYYFRGDFHAYLFASQSTSAGDFSQFAIAKGVFGHAFTLHDNFSARVSTEGGFKIGDSGTNILNFYLGGYGNQLINNIVPFYGYDFLAISGDSYIKALVEVDYRFWEKNHLIASYNIANAADDLYNNGEWFTLPDYTGFALGYGLETFLGPVEVKYSYSPETNQGKWFFSVGFWF